MVVLRSYFNFLLSKPTPISAAVDDVDSEF